MYATTPILLDRFISGSEMFFTVCESIVSFLDFVTCIVVVLATAVSATWVLYHIDPHSTIVFLRCIPCIVYAPAIYTLAHSHLSPTITTVTVQVLTFFLIFSTIYIGGLG